MLAFSRTSGTEAMRLMVVGALCTFSLPAAAQEVQSPDFIGSAAEQAPPALAVDQLENRLRTVEETLEIMGSAQAPSAAAAPRPAASPSAGSRRKHF